MNLYKKVDLDPDEVDLYTQKFLKYLDLTLYENSNYEYVADMEQVWKDCYDILNKVEQMVQSEIMWIKFFVVGAYRQMPIHTDGHIRGDTNSSNVALNWPLLNTKNTYMVWYDAVLNRANVELDKYEDGKVSLYDPTTAKVIGEPLELLYPSLVRTNIPHNVINNNETTRAILSLRFKQDHKILF